MAENSSKVTVIMPVFNREHLVRASIESVLQQTLPPSQFLVVNDGSSDGTAAVLESFRPRITILDQQNLGPYPARNLALKHAEGHYVAFLDSDDVWVTDKIEKQVSVLDDNPDVALVFSNGELLRDAPAKTNQPQSFFEVEAPNRGTVFEALVHTNFIPQSSVLVRKSCFDETGPFFEIPLAADYHKWLQISLRHRFEYIDEMLIRYRVHEGNISRDRTKKYRALNHVFKDLLTSTNDESALKILKRRLIRSEYELALAEMDDALRLTIGGLQGRDKAVSRLERLRCLAEVTWRKTRSFAGLRSFLL
jgi:glycosyltransferase involved in cell wall biosynthesis